MHEHKSFSEHLAIKSMKGRTFTTLFSTFGVIDSYGDIVQPGAFAETFKVRAGQILFLWQHDFEAPPIAQISQLREVSRAELPASILRAFPESTGGAECTATLLDTPRGEEVYQCLKTNVPLQASFAFDVSLTGYDYTDVKGVTVRNIRALKLYEVSLVLWGANPATIGSKRHDRLVAQRHRADAIGRRLAANQPDAERRAQRIADISRRLKQHEGEC